LADVDDRADAKVREMRERMEAAIEERDRAEDEASTNGRRRAREVDELKQKIRDFERDLKRATDDREEVARSEKEYAHPPFSILLCFSTEPYFNHHIFFYFSCDI